jgi:small-conductance mechanosensitive channel/CRP-like cAMP-binding protein
MSHTDDLLWALGLFGSIVLVTALVNRVRTKHRPRVRRLVTLYVLYGAALGTGFGFDTLDMPTWSSSCFAAAQLMQAYLIVSIIGALGFSVLLPTLGMELPLIASDLLVGLGYVVTTLTILARHGLDPTSALVSGAVVSAVLAISLQNTIGNVLGGVALQLDGSIHEGDWIQLENGRQGRVRAVRWRHTVVEARDYSTIIVPNAQLLASNIIILGKRDGTTAPQRVGVTFNVDFRYPPSRVIEVVELALRDAPIENVAPDPQPRVVCVELAETVSSVARYSANFSIQDLGDDLLTSSRVRARVYTALRRAGIPLAVPTTRQVVEVQDEDRAKRRESRQTDERLASLKTVHLFRAFTEDELRQLASGMTHSLYTAGERITRQGAVAHSLYVMTSGAVEVRTLVDRDGDGPDRGQPVTVAQITAPGYFGEMGLITGEPRTADVIAVTDVDCFLLGKETFEIVMLGRPKIADELSETLAQRKVELMSIKEGLDAKAMKARHASERARILGGIKAFFGL